MQTLYDSHVHSCLSFDGNNSIEEYCQQAEREGISGLCFCEHVEFGHIFPHDWNGKLDFSSYAEQIHKARKQYPSLCIGMGIEVGLIGQHMAATEKYLANRPLDLIIASQHIAEGMDPYKNIQYFDKRSVDESVEVFLEETYDNLKQTDMYDIVGHLSYISLRTPTPAPLSYSRFADIWDSILQLVIDKGKGIELNTVSLFMYNDTMPTLSVLKRYKELGGEIITYGSDAHYVQTLGHGYNHAIQLLHAAGFKYLCTYQNRKPTFYPI